MDRKILSDNFYPWKTFLLHLLKPFGGEFFLHCDYNVNDYNISPIFIRRCYIDGQIFALNSICKSTGNNYLEQS